MEATAAAVEGDVKTTRVLRTRKTNPDHENLSKNKNGATTKTTTTTIMKQPKVKRKNFTNVNLCQRFSKAIEDVLVVSKNEDFRSGCFRMLGVKNGLDAGTKIQELATELKGKQQEDEA